MTGLSLAPIGVLLLVACLIAMLSRRLGLPYIVGLVVAGFLIALLPNAPTLPLSRELIFNVLLPPLVFEAALQLDWRRFRDELPLTLTLAFARRRHRRGRGRRRHALARRLELDRRGAVRRSDRRHRPGVGHRRLPRDAAASRACRWWSNPKACSTTASPRSASRSSRRSPPARRPTPASILPAIPVDARRRRRDRTCASARRILLIAGRTDDPLVEITLTTIAAYGSFLIAEHFHASGIISALAAGLDGRQHRLGRVAVGRRREPRPLCLGIFRVPRQQLRLHPDRHERGQPAAAPLGCDRRRSRSLLVLAGRGAVDLSARGACSAGRAGGSRRPTSTSCSGAVCAARWLWPWRWRVPPTVPERGAIIVTAFVVVAFSILVQGLTMPCADQALPARRSRGCRARRGLARRRAVSLLPEPLKIPAFRDFWLARLTSTIAQMAMVIVIGWQVYDIARADDGPEGSRASARASSASSSSCPCSC